MEPLSPRTPGFYASANAPGILTRRIRATVALALVIAAAALSGPGDRRAPQAAATIVAAGDAPAKPAGAAERHGAAPLAPSEKASVAATFGRLPMAFEANAGQVDPDVKFLARGSGYRLFLTATEAVLSLRQLDTREVGKAATSRQEREGRPGTSAAVRMTLPGANPAPQIESLDRLPGVSNYFIGNDPRRWRTRVPTYAGVKYRGVYPGVDLVYYGNQRELEFDFTVAPGSDPKAIRMRPEGVRTITLDATGEVVLGTDGGDVRLRKPTVYQRVDGERRLVAARFVLEGGRDVGFEIGGYDHSRPLIIDPVLTYSNYLGGSAADNAAAVAVDGTGIYLTGFTESLDFPSGSSNAGGEDAYVTKLAPDGSAALYSTYIGGSGEDHGYDIAVDAAGSAYITGYTTSIDFPLSVNRFQSSLAAGSQDAYVAKLGPAGDGLSYSTYLGGSASEWAFSLAIDNEGSAYVTGQTDSTDYPTTPGAVQPTYGGGSDRTY